MDLYSPSNTRTLDVFASVSLTWLLPLLLWLQTHLTFSKIQNANANTRSGDVQAFVTTSQPQAMSVFRAYWTLPPSSAVVPPQPGTGTGGIATLESRAAILLHEVCITAHNPPNQFLSAYMSPKALPLYLRYPLLHRSKQRPSLCRTLWSR